MAHITARHMVISTQLAAELPRPPASQMASGNPSDKGSSRIRGARALGRVLGAKIFIQRSVSNHTAEIFGEKSNGVDIFIRFDGLDR